MSRRGGCNRSACNAKSNAMSLLFVCQTPGLVPEALLQREMRLRALAIPPRYAREMVADWIGAGLAQGKPDVAAWYAANAAKMVLHDDTRALVERLIAEAQQRRRVP